MIITDEFSVFSPNDILADFSNALFHHAHYSAKYAAKKDVNVYETSICQFDHIATKFAADSHSSGYANWLVVRIFERK